MPPPLPFASLVLADIVSTPEMRAVWTEENMLRKWADTERAITEAQAELDMIPREAAATIISQLSAEPLTPERLHHQVEHNRHLMVSFLKAFRQICGPAAEHLHVGPTTQDILDTALVLQMREAHAVVMEQALGLEDVLCRRALEFRDTPMMGRTHEQPALPQTFGFVLACWASDVHDHVERAWEAEGRWMYGVLTGGVGVQNAFVELAGVPAARRLQELVCRKLGLRTPVIDIHGRLDRFAEVTGNLASLASSLGRIGLNLRTWQRPEVGETEMDYGDEEYSSSTMPNKRNPESCERVEGLASLTRALAGCVQGIPVADHRDGVRVPVEYVAIPQCFLMTSRAVATIAGAVGGLVVHEARMRANLDHPSFLGQAAGERFMIALYKKTGRRDWAHTIVGQCGRISHDEQRPLADVIRENPEIGPLFEDGEIERLADLTTYLGTAALQTEEAVSRIRQRRVARRSHDANR